MTLMKISFVHSLRDVMLQLSRRWCCFHSYSPPPLSLALMQFIQEAGFCNVRVEDRTAQFIQVIQTELQRAEDIKEEFIQVSLQSNLKTHIFTETGFTYLHKFFLTLEDLLIPFGLLLTLQEFSEEDYSAIVNGWREKLDRSKSGDQRWGLFHATRN